MRDGASATAVVASVALGVNVGATVGVGCGIPMLAHDVSSSAHSAVASFRYTLPPRRSRSIFQYSETSMAPCALTLRGPYARSAVDNQYGNACRTCGQIGPLINTKPQQSRRRVAPQAAEHYANGEAEDDGDRQ